MDNVIDAGITESTILMAQNNCASYLQAEFVSYVDGDIACGMYSTMEINFYFNFASR